MSHPAHMPVAITMGDAAGIGPEIIAKAFLHSPHATRGCFVAGDVQTMRAAGVTITELSPAEIQTFREPLIGMNRQHFTNRGPKVVEVYEKMLKLSKY